MRFPRPLPLLALLLGLLLAAAPAGAQATRTPDVPYVPTHETIVARMLAIAGVGKNDVLYDLGCGDGRIPITAARKFGTRGVGVDIDPARIVEANDDARKAGVTGPVSFVQQDLFETDIREATAITLYLPEVNLRLRPKLPRELQPGTRVVSHNYDMGDEWKPLTTETMTIDGTDHYVHYWIVPSRGGGRR